MRSDLVRACEDPGRVEQRHIEVRHHEVRALPGEAEQGIPVQGGMLWSLWRVPGRALGRARLLRLMDGEGQAFPLRVGDGRLPRREAQPDMAQRIRVAG